MTGKVVNLRRQRKRRDRAATKAEADRNATVHGLPKAALDLARAREQQARARLDGHRIDDEDAGA